MSDATTPFDLEVDARELNCPLPILRAKKALGQLTAGQVLKIQSDDPGSQRDFEAFARQTGNEIIAASQVGAAWTFFLKRR